MHKAPLAAAVAALLSSSAIAADLPSQVNLAKEQHLVRGNGAEPATLDPGFVNSGMPGDIIANDMFEGLVIESSTGQTIPGQAKQWVMSEDGLTYTFTLKEDLLWSDGEPVTAEDFAFAWRRAADPDTGNDTGHYFVTANIRNSAAVQKGEAEPGALGVVAQDARTLVVTLEKPTPYFMDLMSVKTFFPVPHKVVQKQGEQWTRAEHIATNGAYTLVKWVPNEYVEVTRNPNYWDNDNTVIDKVTYLGLSSQNAELMRYKSGEIDMTNRVQLEHYQTYMQNNPEQIKAQALLGSYVYSFNTKQAPFDDVRVRQALTMTVDRSLLVDKVTGQGEPEAISPVPTTIPDYHADAPAFTTLSGAERLDRAKQLLADAGFGADNPLQFTLTYNTSENHKKIALAIASMWKPLGVKVKLENMEWKAYVSAKSMGDYQLARSWAFGDYPEPSSILQAFTCGHVANESGYCDAGFDDYLQQAAQTADKQERYKLYAKAEALLSEAAPVMPLYHYNHTRLVRHTLKGFPQNNPKGNIYAKDMYFITE